MLHTRIRFGLIFLFIGLGILLQFRTGFENAWPLYLAALILLVSHYLFGMVWVAFNQLKKGKLVQAEQIIQQIKKPEWLIKRNRAYFYFTKGLINLQRKDLEAGEQNLRRALDLGIKRESDVALINLNLAHIYYLRKKFDNARKHLEHAKAQNSGDLLIKDNIVKLERAMASAN